MVLFRVLAFLFLIVVLEAKKEVTTLNGLTFDVVWGTKGFYRVGNTTEGVWWFIDPNDNAFFGKSVTSVNRGGRAEGRRGPYADAVDAKYGTDTKPFVESTIKRLNYWHFNFLGAWCTPDFWTPEFPYTIDLEFSFETPFCIRGSLNLPDVYSLDWLNYIDQRAKNICSLQKDSKTLVGYFTDNELGWGQLNTSLRTVSPSNTPSTSVSPSLTQMVMSNSSTASYGYAWDYVLNKYQNSLTTLSKAWNLPVVLSTRSDLDTFYTQKGLAIISETYQKDDDEFSYIFATTYVKRTTQAIRKYDTNHLVIGQKHGAPTSNAIYRSESHSNGIDIVSIDNYHYDMYKRIGYYWEGTNHMPILVAEYSWSGSGCNKNGTWPPSPDYPVLCCKYPGYPPDDIAVQGMACPVPNEPKSFPFSSIQRLNCNGGYALALAITHPGIVGYTWYRWVDQNPVGQDPTQSFGLVNIVDDVNLYTVQVLSVLNQKAELIHASQSLEPILGGRVSNDVSSWEAYCPIF